MMLTLCIHHYCHQRTEWSAALQAWTQIRKHSRHATMQDNRTSSQQNQRAKGIGWTVPLKTTGLLTTGIILAVAHHIFYCALNHRQAHSGFNAWDTEDQAWSVRIGTGLALLAKTSSLGPFPWLTNRIFGWISAKRIILWMESIYCSQLSTMSFHPSIANCC